MATGSELIRVEHIKKEYVGGTVKALNDCSLSVARGEVVAIIGPSGSGKSTLLRCLNLLETPTSGKVIFDGVDITDTKVDLDLHRRKMGMVFQHFNLFPNMTVKKNITLAPVTLKLKTQAEADKLAMELLERIDLSDKALIDKILSEMQKIYANENVNTIDGVKISFEDKKQWVHLRRSNTEPIIRIYAEAATKEEADALANEVIGIAQKIIGQ